MFSLADIEALSTGGASYSTILSPTTINIILTALDFMGDHRNWSLNDTGGELSAADLDRIDELVALVSDEVTP